VFARLIIAFISRTDFDLSHWIAGNPTDVLATNFSKPAALFERSPRGDLFMVPMDGHE
jgi:oxalate decarboxylase